MFTIEDESTLASLQPQTETSETVGEIGSVGRQLVMKYIRKKKTDQARQRFQMKHRLGC